jgi:hypothetical protein
MLIGKSRSKAVKNIEDWVGDRLQSWKVNFLSQPERSAIEGSHSSYSHVLHVGVSSTYCIM